MPYGVRVRMNGRFVGHAPWGRADLVCSFTPSRIGIMTSVESNIARRESPACVCAPTAETPIAATSAAAVTIDRSVHHGVVLFSHTLRRRKSCIREYSNCQRE